MEKKLKILEQKSLKQEEKQLIVRDVILQQTQRRDSKRT